MPSQDIRAVAGHSCRRRTSVGQEDSEEGGQALSCRRQAGRRNPLRRRREAAALR